MINIQFSTPQEISSFCMLFNHPDIIPPQQTPQTVYAIPVQSRSNTPPPPPVKLAPKTDLKTRERQAAERHWQFIELRNEWYKKDLNEKAIKDFINFWLETANSWYKNLTSKEKYGLMRGPNVWLLSQCDAAWERLSDFDKANICRRSGQYNILQVKDEFLPPDIN